MLESDSLDSPKTHSSGRQSQTKLPNPLKCPRCESTNTKFCYYNNYNKTQPRYLCKACKRHWTEGGILRSVPIGGGRKNKRLRRPNITATTTMATKSNPSKGQDSLFERLSDHHKDTSDVESYTDIEELKGLVSWDFNGSFIGCAMPSSQQCQLPSTSNFLELNNWNWNDLDTMIQDDLNKPWEDPSFGT